MTKDQEHLRLLVVFHYVVAGMTALFSLVPLIHVAIGLAILSGKLDPPEGDEIPEAIAWIFVIAPGFFILCGLCLAVLIALAGRNLQRRRSHTFCVVVAGLSCVFMPFGTVLGVFTIIVLMRDSVKDLFAGPPTSVVGH